MMGKQAGTGRLPRKMVTNGFCPAPAPPAAPLPPDKESKGKTFKPDEIKRICLYSTIQLLAETGLQSMNQKVSNAFRLDDDDADDEDEDSDTFDHWAGRLSRLKANWDQMRISTADKMVALCLSRFAMISVS